MMRFFSLPVLVIFLSVVSNLSYAGQEGCSIYGAQYKPHKAYFFPGALPKKDTNYDFVMTINKPSKEETAATHRTIFFNIDAFKPNTTEKLSTIRMGDVCSNGIVVCNISTDEGQFSQTSEMKDLKRGLSFEIITLDRDFFRINHNGPKAPYAIILPNTAGKIKTYYRPDEAFYKDTVKSFVHFYTEDNIFPDFSGYDIWVRSSCGVQ